MQKTTGPAPEHLTNTNYGWESERTSDFLRNFIGERLAKLATIKIEEDE